MDKLKKLLCCLWSTPTAILIATILYLYADRNEYIYLANINKVGEYEEYEGDVVQVTNKWTGNSCLAFTTFENSSIIKGKHGHYDICVGYYTR